MKRIDTPDISLPSAPDVGDLADGVLDGVIDLAGHAADAISSAAGLLPGVDDYRASSRNRNLLLTVGVIAAVIAIVAYLKKRSAAADDQR